MTTTEDLSEIVCARDLSAYLKSYSHSLSSNANESIAQIIEVLPFELKLCIIFSARCNCFCSYNDFTFIRSAQITLKHLFLSSHDCSQRCFNRAYQVMLTIPIVVNHFEFQLLFLLKEILDCESLLKVWVQVIADYFCLCHFHPFIIFLLIHDAARIRF